MTEVTAPERASYLFSSYWNVIVLMYIVEHQSPEKRTKVMLFIVVPAGIGTDMV